MKYLLLVCWDAERMNADDEPVRDEEPESFPWLDDLRARNAWVIGDQVAAPKRARTVRVRGGKTLVTDGPFADTKEAVGGFDVIEAGSLEEAEKERQVLRADAFFIEGKNVGAAIGVQQIIRILHAFGDALEAPGCAHVVSGEHGAELVKSNVSIDRHGLSGLHCGRAWLQSRHRSQP